jgi:hypothetical protein
MKKFMEVVKRQTELAAKAAAGTATKDELAELTKLNAVVKAAMLPTQKSATTLVTMTLAAFREWHEKTVKQLEEGDADVSLLALVKRNVEAVKAQGKTKADDVVAVELPVEKTDADKVEALEQRIADLEAKLTGKAAGGSAKPDAPPPAEGGTPPAGGGKPTAQALAMEAVDTLLAKYAKLKQLVDAGTFSKDELCNIFDGDWQLKDIISQAAAVMAKAEELKKAAEETLAELQKLDDSEGADGTEGGDADGTEGGKDGKNADGTQKAAGGKPATGGKPSRWTSGLDMAPEATAREQAAAIKAAKAKRG